MPSRDEGRFALHRAAVSLPVFAVLAFALITASTDTRGAAQEERPPVAAADPNGSCVTCHTGIEEMHPFSPVSCVQCHGGDATATEKEKSHVKQRTRPPGDERVLGQSFDPDYLRFQDPGNLRVAAQSCGPCHGKAVYDTEHSLHATTAGHLGDGLYENGVVEDRHPNVSVFAVKDTQPDDVPRPKAAVRALRQIPSFSVGSDPKRMATHFSDVPRKACMQCHLWSRGRAVRGRAGMDGDYRGEGCSACHVPYADDGLSASRDPTVNRFEPGHPERHRMVRFPTTDNCVRCHYGDASIGLSFRGLAQPVPGMPQTPDAPGLHPKRLNGVYYIDDPASTPADVHHQAGMHCVDCHMRDDVMGDGFLYTRMEDAVGVRCQTCHGTPDAYATGIDERGAKLPHLVLRGTDVYLTSRVTGKQHRVKQARDVVRPGSKDYNARAAFAMTADHGRMECYACHSGWSPNFFGFHFDRNESFDQLDLISGKRTGGRVTTQEKVFSTFKQFYLGWNSHGRIAPYMVGFSTMATVHDDQGGLVLDQVLAETRDGLSGMTMIHHQTHTTTARARQCVECHRSPATFGRGSVNFKLLRDFVFAGGVQGVRAFSFDRKTPADTTLLSSAGVDDVRAVAVLRDRLQGQAQYVFAASPVAGLVSVDVRSPGFPRIAARLEGAVESPERALVLDDLLAVSDGRAGLRFFDVSDPSRPKAKSTLDEIYAYDVAADGPDLFVASGPKGLSVVRLSDRDAPVVLLASFDLNGSDTAAIDARRIETMFQYSRPNPTELEGPRSAPRNLAVMAAGADGVFLLDVTEPAAPLVLTRLPRTRTEGTNVVDVALGTIYELGSEGGAIATAERDYAAIVGTLGGTDVLVMLDVTDPSRPEVKGSVGLARGTRAVRIVCVYNPPFLQTFAVTAHATGIEIFDISRPVSPTRLGSVNQALGAADVDVEEFGLDRTVDGRGAPIMAVSHEGARWLDQREFLRVIGTPVFGPSPGDERERKGDDR